MNRTFVLVAAVALTTVIAPPVHAAGAPGYCHVDTVIESPEGLTLESGPATFTSSGTAVCFGGLQSTGPGTYTSSGTFEGACTGVTGEFDYRITVPTAQGERTIADHGTFTTPYFTSEKGFGTFQLAPIEGDCVTAPLTKMQVYGQFFQTG